MIAHVDFRKRCLIAMDRTGRRFERLERFVKFMRFQRFVKLGLFKRFNAFNMFKRLIVYLCVCFILLNGLKYFADLIV